MDRNEIIVTAQESGERIDALLARSLPQFSRSALQGYLVEGRVLLCGRELKKNYKTKEGERYVVLPPEPVCSQILPQAIPLEIVFEDEDLLVVNKRRGMVVHPAPGHYEGTLVNALLHHCAGSLSGIGGEIRPGIVHRIDKDTSGLLIVAKNDFSHLALSAQLSDHSLYRVYEAVVRGAFRDDQGTVDKPIGRHPIDRKKMAVTEKNARHAVTHWQVLCRYPGYTHIRCRLETGRTHQIRVHLASIGHPLLGDETYGAPSPDKGLEGQCLHARELRFVHPRSLEEISLRTELPDYFQTVLDKLGNPIT